MEETKQILPSQIKVFTDIGGTIMIPNPFLQLPTNIHYPVLYLSEAFTWNFEQKHLYNILLATSCSSFQNQEQHKLTTEDINIIIDTCDPLVRIVGLGILLLIAKLRNVVIVADDVEYQNLIKQISLGNDKKAHTFQNKILQHYPSIEDCLSELEETLSKQYTCSTMDEYRKLKDLEQLDDIYQYNEDLRLDIIKTYNLRAQDNDFIWYNNHIPNLSLQLQGSSQEMEREWFYNIIFLLVSRSPRMLAYIKDKKLPFIDDPKLKLEYFAALNLSMVFGIGVEYMIPDQYTDSKHIQEIHVLLDRLRGLLLFLIPQFFISTPEERMSITNNVTQPWNNNETGFDVNLVNVYIRMLVHMYKQPKLTYYFQDYNMKKPTQIHLKHPILHFDDLVKIANEKHHKRYANYNEALAEVNDIRATLQILPVTNHDNSSTNNTDPIQLSQSQQLLRINNIPSANKWLLPGSNIFVENAMVVTDDVTRYCTKEIRKYYTPNDPIYPSTDDTESITIPVTRQYVKELAGKPAYIENHIQQLLEYHSLKQTDNDHEPSLVTKLLALKLWYLDCCEDDMWKCMDVILMYYALFPYPCDYEPVIDMLAQEDSTFYTRTGSINTYPQHIYSPRLLKALQYTPDHHNNDSDSYLMRETLTLLDVIRRVDSLTSLRTVEPLEWIILEYQPVITPIPLMELDDDYTGYTGYAGDADTKTFEPTDSSIVSINTVLHRNTGLQHNGNIHETNTNTEASQTDTNETDSNTNLSDTDNVSDIDNVSDMNKILPDRNLGGIQRIQYTRIFNEPSLNLSRVSAMDAFNEKWLATLPALHDKHNGDDENTTLISIMNQNDNHRKQLHETGGVTKVINPKEFTTIFDQDKPENVGLIPGNNQWEYEFDVLGYMKRCYYVKYGKPRIVAEEKRMDKWIAKKYMHLSRLLRIPGSNEINLMKMDVVMSKFIIDTYRKLGINSINLRRHNTEFITLFNRTENITGFRDMMQKLNRIMGLSIEKNMKSNIGGESCSYGNIQQNRAALYIAKVMRGEEIYNHQLMMKYITDLGVDTKRYIVPVYWSDNPFANLELYWSVSDLSNIPRYKPWLYTGNPVVLYVPDEGDPTNLANVKDLNKELYQEQSLNRAYNLVCSWLVIIVIISFVAFLVSSIWDIPFTFGLFGTTEQVKKKDY